MAVLAQVCVALATFSALALANNVTSGGGDGNSTSTTVTTLTTSTTLTTFTGTTTLTSTSTTANPNGVQSTDEITGTISMTITGDCAAFCGDSSVNLAMRKAIATVTGVAYTNVDVTLTHTCSRRMAEFQRGKSALRRRLGGAVLVTYSIALPVGSSITGAAVSSSITSTSKASWTSTLASKLVAEGISSSTYTVTVTDLSDPVVQTITLTTTTTTLPMGIDSSAWLPKAFSMAHLWGLFLLLAVNNIFA